MSPEVSPYDAVIADLELKRDQISAMIESLRQMKNLAQSVAIPGTFQQRQPEQTLAHDEFFGMTIPDAAKKLLQIRKKTMPHPDVCEAILEHGIKSSATNFRETARAALSRSPEFVKVNSEWGLVEWYPGLRRLRRDRKKRLSQQTDDGIEIESEAEAEAKEPALLKVVPNPISA